MWELVQRLPCAVVGTFFADLPWIEPSVWPVPMAVHGGTHTHSVIRYVIYDAGALDSN